MAACPSLGLLVTSDISNDTLSVWSLPNGAETGIGSELVLEYTLGGRGSPASMQFDFASGVGFSGYLAFTPQVVAADISHLLLVTDHGHDVVHVVDVVSRAHAGYVAAPRSISGPRGVAATGDLVAISAWEDSRGCDHVVHIYRVGSGGGSHWTHVRVIGRGVGYSDGQLQQPYGLRFSGDGAAICVADWRNGRVSLFHVGDGRFVRHIATELNGPRDVEEVKNGWVVACWGSDTVEFARNDGDGDGDCIGPFLGKADGGTGIRDGEFDGPVALALVPALGLIVRDCWNSRLKLFSTPDMLAMRAMSAIRIGWMTATFRAIGHRQSLRGARRRQL